MSDIFLSYAREDEERVRPIIEYLEQHFGWEVFWDRRNIPPGEFFHLHIAEKLDTAKCVLVAWSKHSVASGWVLEEAEEGKSRKVLVPLLLDQIKPPLGFRNIQVANLNGWNNDTSHEQLKACVERIASFVPKRGQPDPEMPKVSKAPALRDVLQPQLPENFVLIRGGQFTMGSPEGEANRYDEETQHEVKLSDFAMCKYVVTVGEYREYADAKKIVYDDGEKRDSLPAANVSWHDAVAYCDWLSKKHGGLYRLSTEAEWEYACRAGTTTPFNTGENLTTDQANYNGIYPYRDYPKGEYRRKTLPVDSFEPNGFGLYNMHGNVNEWCGDGYYENYYEECRKQGLVENPQGPETSFPCVVRGGCWNRPAQSCRSAARNARTFTYRSSDVGFRLVFVPQLQGPS